MFVTFSLQNFSVVWKRLGSFFTQGEVHFILALGPEKLLHSFTLADFMPLFFLVLVLFLCRIYFGLVRTSFICIKAVNLIIILRSLLFEPRLKSNSVIE